MLLVAIYLNLSGFTYAQKTSVQQPDPWLQLDQVLSQIKPPVFANKDFVFTSYSAKGDDFFIFRLSTPVGRA